MQTQLADINELPDDATQRGWDSETARHTRTADSIASHLQHLGIQPAEQPPS